MNMITEYPQFTYSKNRFFSTESEDEAKAFAIFWGGSYKEIVSFPNNYFKIEI